MEYKLIDENTVEKLNIEVNKYLAKGWELYGSPSFSIDTWYHFFQAVVKKNQ